MAAHPAKFRNLQSAICNLQCAGFSTSTWTRSTRRWSSATTRRCGDGPWRWAVRPPAAASSRRPAMRRATFGVRSAMPMAHAVRLCPHLLIVRPEFKKYRAVSSQVFAIFREVTPLVEPLSLDEAYLDVTENAWGEPLGRTVAERLKARIRDETGLTASAGVAPEQVPRQDRLGLEEAGRADRHRARTRRALPAGPADRRAVGRRPRHRHAAARARHREAGRRAGHRRGRPARDRRQPGAVAAAAGPRRGRSPGRAQPRGQVGQQREHLQPRSHRPGRDSVGGRRDGARRGGVARPQAAARADGDRSRCATTTSRPSPARSR